MNNPTDSNRSPQPIMHLVDTVPKKMRLRLVPVIALALTLIAPCAWSHDLWLNMTDYTPALWQHAKYAPKPRAITAVYIGWGHSFPVADFISDHVWGGLERIEPDGTRVPMQVGSEGFRAVRLELHTPGPRVFAARLNPEFYGTVAGRVDFHQTYYENYAKALVSVLPQKTLPLDGPTDNPFATPIGHKVEIVPLVNPNRLQPGDQLPVQVLIEGRPAPDYEVSAVNLFAPTSEQVKTYSDQAGIAVLQLDTFFGPWLVKAAHEFPATGEMAKKCENISYTATMTFALPYVKGN